MKNEEATVATPFDTFYDTPARTGQSEIDQTHEALRADLLLNQILEGIADPAVVLEHNRQMVLVNSLAADLFEDAGTFDAIGRRIGEAITCIHADDMPAGCGTSQACATCGVAAAIRSTRTGMQRDRRDARVTIHPDGQHRSLDLRATTAVLTWEGRNLTLVSLKDISDENRRQALERVFFHDILNTAGAVSGLATLIPDTTDPSELSELHTMLQSSSEQLVQEIENQRDLVRAEHGDLKVSPTHVNVRQILDSVHSLYSRSPWAEGKNILVDALGTDFTVESDHTMLVRCIGNLVKNALEASVRGQNIVLTATPDCAFAAIKVKNECVMPEDVRLQVFQRSFSTKASHGRGLGTYSVKLLVEQYLCGKVECESAAEMGTVFTLNIPRVFAGRVS